MIEDMQHVLQTRFLHRQSLLILQLISPFSFALLLHSFLTAVLKLASIQVLIICLKCLKLNEMKCEVA